VTTLCDNGEGAGRYYLEQERSDRRPLRHRLAISKRDVSTMIDASLDDWAPTGIGGAKPQTAGRSKNGILEWSQRTVSGKYVGRVWSLGHGTYHKTTAEVARL